MNTKKNSLRKIKKKINNAYRYSNILSSKRGNLSHDEKQQQ